MRGEGTARAKPRLAIPARAKPRLAIPAGAKPRLAIPAGAKPRLEIPAGAKPRLAIPAGAKLRLAVAGVCLAGWAAAQGVWLTRERRAQLEAIASRPYIERKASLADGREVLEWTNGARSWVTTQEVRRVLGAPATNAWMRRVEAERVLRVRAEEERETAESRLRQAVGAEAGRERPGK